MKIEKVDFSLQPFGHEGTLHDFNITGIINRDSGRLKIMYELSGPLKEIVIPGHLERQTRTERLWENTCFELFLNPQDSHTYWEFNLSPSGSWNIYRFDAYRQGMLEEPAFITLTFGVATGQESLILDLEFNAGMIIPAGRVVNIGICAVLKSVNGVTTYWALTHKGNRPDFHRRDSFIIELP